MLQLLRSRISWSLRKSRAVRTAATKASALPSTWPPTLSEPLQSYISLSHDPYINLSIERHLLLSTPHDSAVLFLYRNRPCVVIGRNQNPWTEVNLPLLKSQQESRRDDKTKDYDYVRLVRRRSGGGTVYHDLGNLNWTVICPSAGFTRDKHAEMMVRASRGCGIDRARVNERHDIVLDQGIDRRQIELQGDQKDNLHGTPYSVPDGTHSSEPASLKVSGSAYKLTRRRALHHGTLLLSTADLDGMGRYLRSPGKPHISAKGVESVSSPVAKLELSHDDVMPAIQYQFQRLYEGKDVAKLETVKLQEVDALTEPAVKQSCDEMKTLEWTYGQTPQFSFSTDPPALKHIARDSGEEAVNSSSLPVCLKLSLRHGRINDVELSHRRDAEIVRADIVVTQNWLKELPLWGDWSWSTSMEEVKADLDEKQRQELARRMENILPVMQ